LKSQTLFQGQQTSTFHQKESSIYIYCAKSATWPYVWTDSNLFTSNYMKLIRFGWKECAFFQIL